MFLGVFVLIPILITIFTPGGTSPSPESSPLATANEATGQLAEKWPNQELSDNYVREAIKETIENEWIKNVEIIDVYDYKIDPKNKFRYANLIITINPGEKWDGRQYLKDMAQYYVKCAQILFQHRRIYNFTLVGLSVFTDEYGKDGIDTAVRITWDRTISKKVDYDNFMDMAATDYTRVFSIAKEHYVCYAILKGLDDSEGELLR